MSGCFRVIKDCREFKKDNENGYLCECESCGNYNNNTAFFGDETCLFTVIVICSKCGHEMIGFKDEEMNVRFKNKFTPLYCNTNLIQEPHSKLELELYFKYLDFLMHEFDRFSIEFGIDCKIVEWVELHLMNYHKKSICKMVNSCERNAHEYKSRTHTVCFMCGSTENLEHHHIIPVSEGGDNNSKNLISLCRDCHVKIHSLNKMAGRI